MSQKESKLVRNSLNDIIPNNSDKAAQKVKSEQKDPKNVKKLEPIVKKGNVVKKRRTVMDKFKESFLGESENLGDYMIYDILIPAFRDTVSDLGFGLIERLVGGGRSRPGRGSFVRDRGRSYVSYNSRDRGRDDRRDLDRETRSRHDFDRVVFTHKWEAEDVLAHLVEMVVEYGEATVRSFYELSNIESEYTDDRYGWTNLRDAYVTRTRNGFIIVFPQTRPL